MVVGDLRKLEWQRSDIRAAPRFTWSTRGPREIPEGGTRSRSLPFGHPTASKPTWTPRRSVPPHRDPRHVFFSSRALALGESLPMTGSCFGTARFGRRSGMPIWPGIRLKPPPPGSPLVSARTTCRPFAGRNSPVSSQLMQVARSERPSRRHTAMRRSDASATRTWPHSSTRPTAPSSYYAR